jgi:short-subunit dehydrogenase
MRSEVEEHNIKVAIVCPGPVESEIANHAHKNPNYPAVVRHVCY